MDYVWEIIEPYVAAVVAVIVAGLTIYATIRPLISKIINKNNSMLNATFNIDSLSQKVAEKLAGKTLNIDVTAVTEKALKKLSKELDEKIDKIEKTANSLKGILAPIGKGIIKLKALTKEEVSELARAIKALEGEYRPPDPDEVMTVMLQPIALEEGSPAPAAVNFGGLE